MPPETGTMPRQGTAPGISRAKAAAPGTMRTGEAGLALRRDPDRSCRAGARRIGAATPSHHLVASAGWRVDPGPTSRRVRPRAPLRLLGEGVTTRPDGVPAPSSASRPLVPAAGRDHIAVAN